MKSKYDNDYKAKVLELGIDKKVRDIKKKCYKMSKFYYVDEETGQIDKVSPLWQEWFNVNKHNPKFDCALRLEKSKYNKAKKIRDKISQLVKESNAVFITLTFTDEVLSKTSPTTRRKYVARYLKEVSPIYVANVDYSPEKNREHYHAITINRADFSKWKYGFVYAEQVRNHDHDVMRTSKYIAKLTSHALKTSPTTRLIYSRDTL